MWDTGHQGGPEGAVSAGDFQVACSCRCVSGSPEQVSPPAGPGGVPATPAAPRRGQRRGPSSSWAGGRLGGPGPWAPGQGWAALMLWLCPPQSWGSPGGPARWRTWSSSCASGPRGSRLGEVGASPSTPSCGQGTCPPVHTPPGGTGAGNAGDLQGEPRVPWVCGDGAPSASAGTSELRALVTPGPLPCPSPGSQSFDQVPEVVYREVKDVTPGGPSAGTQGPSRSHPGLCPPTGTPPTFPLPGSRAGASRPAWTTLTCAGNAAAENGPRVSASLRASGTRRPVASGDRRQPVRSLLRALGDPLSGRRGLCLKVQPQTQPRWGASRGVCSEVCVTVRGVVAGRAGSAAFWKGGPRGRHVPPGGSFLSSPETLASQGEATAAPAPLAERPQATCTRRCCWWQ